MATSNAATTYLEHAILDFLFKNNSESFQTMGNNIYIGLATAVSSIEAGTVTEANFGNYSRVQVAHANWTLPAVGTDAQIVSNTNNVEWSASSSGSNTITHVFIINGTGTIATSGASNRIFFVGQLDSPRTIASGDIFRINAGSITIQLN